MINVPLLLTVDTCPQRYDTGADPYEKNIKVYVLNVGSALRYDFIRAILAVILLSWFTL